MKGVFVLALKELTTQKAGLAKWQEAFGRAGFGMREVILPITEVDDTACKRLIGALCIVLRLTITELGEMFGMFWMTVYVPRIFSLYFKNIRSAREFILRLDNIHQSTGNFTPNARPPRFACTEQDQQTILIKYTSHREMIEFVIGLLYGLGAYYKEELVITPVGNSTVRVVFPSGKRK